MVHQSIRSNPYTIINNAESGSIFLGRKKELEQLRTTLFAQQPESSQPIILIGPQKIGKTAILTQINNGLFGDTYLPIYIDLNLLTCDSINSFCWDLAHKLFTQLSTYEITIQSFNQTAFMAAPLQALQMQILQPAAQSGKRLLFLFDNLDSVIVQIKNEKLPSNILETLHNQIRESNNGATIFTLDWESAYEPLEKAIPYLKTSDIHELGPLTQKDSHTLICQPVSYTIVKDVAQYIYQITKGYPENIHLLCYHLYERHQNLDLAHITVADVAMVTKIVREEVETETAVSHIKPTYSIQPNPTLTQTIHTVDKSAEITKQPLFYGALLLVAMLAFLIIPSLIPNQPEGEQSISSNLVTFTDGTTTVVDQENISALQPTRITTQTPISTQNSTEMIATPNPTSSPTQTATITPTPTNTPDRYPDVITRSQDGMTMVYISAGNFLMGSNKGDFLSALDEQPQHEVTLDAFYIDKFEVNIEQYAAFLNRLGDYQRACNNVDCTLPKSLAGYTSYLIEQDLGDGTLQYIPVTGFANYPANHISWYGAQAYCQSVGSRLPTEAEWEYAARGTDGRLYPWGNNAPDETLAIFQSNSFDNMKPVDALPAGVSPFGIFSMAGSLWEWTSDWYNETYYQISPNHAPLGPETGFARVVRGGAWPFNNQAERIRTSNRFSLAPDFISSTVGFRCAQNP
jgi:formylglycine-generating enzyme required for sulfatase activity